MTRADISAYNEKLEENTRTLCFLNNGSHSNAAAPIGMPSPFASFEREITQPSLFERTTTGFPMS